MCIAECKGKKTLSKLKAGAKQLALDVSSTVETRIYIYIYNKNLPTVKNLQAEIALFIIIETRNNYS